MVRKRRSEEAEEEQRLETWLDSWIPREPHLRIYRITDERKQVFLTTSSLGGFDPEQLREEYGAGKFLLRTVRSNGKWGPSRVLRIAAIIQ